MGVLRQGQLQASLAEQRRAGGRLGSLLLERGHITEEDLSRALASQKGLDWLPADQLKPQAKALAMVDPGTARAFGALPIDIVDGKLRVAVSDPDVLPLLADLEGLTGKPTQPVMAEPGALEEAVEKAYAKQTAKAAGPEETEASQAAPIVRLLESILTRAVRDKAADVHLEPYQGDFRIRMRVDGILYEIDPPPAHLAPAIISRVKVLANLDISETRMPQDGRIEMVVDGRTVDFRVSTVPIQGGESVVLRILDRQSLQLDLSKLGLVEDEREQLMEFIQKPHGIVLVTGPTGSGKTTTLYSLLSQVNTPDRKILTVEDPVEYDLDGIVQVPIKEDIGVGYSSILRTMLRQDPDIILVGEIRDPETAQIAVEAALTGHLVLSTLHTNSAAETLTRMMNMGVPAFNIATSVSLIIAQRLGRRLCNSCKQPSDVPQDVLLKEGFTQEQIDTGFTLYRPKGCDKCNGGYKGRVGIYEVVKITDELANMIMEEASSIKIAKQAQAEGFRNLRQSALMKVIEGVTSLEEANRVTKD